MLFPPPQKKLNVLNSKEKEGQQIREKIPDGDRCQGMDRKHKLTNIEV